MIRYRGRQYREAYIRQDLSWLKSYLSMSDKEEAIELAYQNAHLFVEWVIKTGAELPEGLTYADVKAATDAPWDIVDEYAHLFSDAALKQFREYAAAWFMEYDPQQAPSFLFFSGSEVIKNQWLIHFTHDAQAIQKEGFTSGTDDLTKLGLTEWMEDSVKPGGYNFAFLLSDFVKYGRDPMNYRTGWKYGEEAVLFRASGLRLWHSGDEEPQVVFWGADAKDAVALEPGFFLDHNDELDGWIVMPCNQQETPYGAEDLDDVVQWVVDNFQQYRKVLVCSK